MQGESSRNKDEVKRCSLQHTQSGSVHFWGIHVEWLLGPHAQIPIQFGLVEDGNVSPELWDLGKNGS